MGQHLLYELGVLGRTRAVERSIDPGMYCCLELFVHVGPRGAHPAFADRLRGVLVETGTQGPGDHAVDRPYPEQVLTQEKSGDPGGRGVAGLRAVDEVGPPLRDLGQDADACPDVLTPLGVMRRQ